MTVAAALATLSAPALLGLTAWLLPSLNQPTLAFGVRVPASHRDAPVVTAQRRAYHRLVGAACTAIPLAAAVVLATGRVWPAMLAAAGLTVVTAVAYLRAHRAIAATKREQDWYAGLRQVTAVDTTLRTRPEPFPWPWAGPALAVVLATAVAGIVRYPHLPDLITVHLDAGGTPDRQLPRSVPVAFAPVLLQVVLTGLLLGVTRIGFGARADLDPRDPAGSGARHRRFVAGFARRLLVLIACLDAALGVIAWAMWDAGPAPALVVPVLLLVAAGVVPLVAFAVRAGQGGHRLAGAEAGAPAAGPTRATGPDGTARRDDDAHWRLGLVYVNPADPAVVVPQRVGVGWTLNFARPLAWVALAVVLAAPAVPVLLLAAR